MEFPISFTTAEAIGLIQSPTHPTIYITTVYDLRALSEKDIEEREKEEAERVGESGQKNIFNALVSFRIPEEYHTICFIYSGHMYVVNLNNDTAFLKNTKSNFPITYDEILTITGNNTMEEAFITNIEEKIRGIDNLYYLGPIKDSTNKEEIFLKGGIGGSSKKTKTKSKRKRKSKRKTKRKTKRKSKTKRK
jgi:hypothetical protein